MKLFTKTAIATAVSATLMLSGCLNGGDSSTSNLGPQKTVTGVITGFGSVFVNGVEYETDSASVSVDGQPSLEDQLEVGMVVTLTGQEGANGTGVASAITFDDDVEGPVTMAYDSLSGSIEVLGQTILITAQTVYEDEASDATVLDIASLAVGQVVEISGFRNTNGEIFATRIELKKNSLGSGDEIEVKGVIASVDTAASTFTIGGQVISYAATTVFDDLAGIDASSVGLLVEAKSNQPLDNNGVMIADKIELEDGDENKIDDSDEGEEIEMQGMVTNAPQTNDAGTIVEINGQQVLITDSTEFEHGSLDDLIAATNVEVEGDVVNGMLVAEEIEFKRRGDLELEATVDSVDLDANTLTVAGLTFGVNNDTFMIDDSDSQVQYFNLASLTVGEFVEIKAYRDETSGALVATKVERDDLEAGKSFSLEGKLDAAVADGGTSVSISGITVTVNAVVGGHGAGTEVEISFTGAFENATLTLDD